jgi:hypothetical protein
MAKKRSVKWRTWNKGVALGQKDAFTPEQVKRIRQGARPSWRQRVQRPGSIDPERTLPALKGVPHRRGKTTDAFFLCGWFKQLFVSKSQVLALKCAVSL